MGKKESTEENLGPGIVLKTNESLQNVNEYIYIYIFFDNFFNSLSQLVKLYERGFYGIGTA